jgi:hypothetical protein
MHQFIISRDCMLMQEFHSVKLARNINKVNKVPESTCIRHYNYDSCFKIAMIKYAE